MVGCLGGIVPFLGPGESLRRAHEGLIKKLALHPDSESKREEEGGKEKRKEGKEKERSLDECLGVMLPF